MSSMKVEEYYTTGEAARYLGVSQSTIGNYIRRGIIEPDLILPSSGKKSGRQKFKQSTLMNFKNKMDNGEIF